MTGQRCSAHEWQVESGQILLSKLARGGLNLAALIIAEKMNQAHDFWYKLSGGDKDTFVSLCFNSLLAGLVISRDCELALKTDLVVKTSQRYAFFFLGIRYTPAPHFLSLVGSTIPNFEGHTFCGHSMLQYGLSSSEWDPILAANPKFDPESSEFEPPNHPPPLFVHANLLKHSGYSE